MESQVSYNIDTQWAYLPEALLGPSDSTPGWWRRGWGRREGWGILEGRREGDPEPSWGVPLPPLPGAPPPPPPPLLLLPPGAAVLGRPGPPVTPTWFLWYSMGEGRAVMGK